MGEKGLSGAVERREHWSRRKVREGEVNRGMHKSTSPKPLAGKRRGAAFVFLQPVRLEGWCFKGQPYGWERALRALLLERMQTGKLGVRQCDLRNL